MWVYVCMFPTHLLGSDAAEIIEQRNIDETSLHEYYVHYDGCKSPALITY